MRADEMTLVIRETEQGELLLPVHAQPGAKRNAIVGVHAGRLKVAVTQIAEKGKANTALLKLLAKSLGVSPSALELVTGETSSKKVVKVRGLSLLQMQERIRELQ